MLHVGMTIMVVPFVLAFCQRHFPGRRLLQGDALKRINQPVAFVLLSEIDIMRDCSRYDAGADAAFDEIAA